MKKTILVFIVLSLVLQPVAIAQESMEPETLSCEAITAVLENAFSVYISIWYFTSLLPPGTYPPAIDRMKYNLLKICILFGSLAVIKGCY